MTRFFTRAAHPSFAGLMLASVLMLGACGTPGGQPPSGKTLPPSQAQQNAPIDGAVSLPAAERAYRANPDSVKAAVRYSRALREAGRLSRASIIIAPFARDDRKPSASAKTEFAAVQVGLGNNTAAVDYARKATIMNPQSWLAHYVLGLALDGKGDHPNAEKELRKAIELSPGDPSAILNDLGLNLASQGFLDEATEVLQEALKTTSDKASVERNLRIVAALGESGGRAPSYMQNARKDARKKEEEAAAKNRKKQDASRDEDLPDADDLGDEARH